MTLPPGQRRVDGFPRFGTHLHHSPPSPPDEPAITVGGRTVSLAGLPRREQTADFHCVAGWSATGLRWEGVRFADLYATIAAPGVTHVVFGGLDGFEAVLLLEDALGDDVLLADRLDGRPLGADHGAPVRLVSPRQYGYMSVKHLCRIEPRTSAPTRPGTASGLARLALSTPLIQRHPRARVAGEERHAYLPGRALRLPYRLLTPPIAFLSRRGR